MVGFIGKKKARLGLEDWLVRANSEYAVTTHKSMLFPLVTSSIGNIVYNEGALVPKSDYGEERVFFHAFL